MAASWKMRMAAVGAVMLAGVTGVACSSTNSTSSTTPSAGSGGSKIPSSAFNDHTGITSSSVQLANVSTLDLGLFKGAAVGTEAYADYRSEEHTSELQSLRH